MKKLTFIISALVLCAAVFVGCAKKDADTPVNSDSPSSVISSEPTEDEIRKQKYDEVVSKASELCTLNQPQVTDPSTWNEKGAEIMHALSNQFGTAIKEQPGWKYWLCVNRAASTVTVYTPDENGEYTVPYMAFVCSGGTDTPTGYFETPVNYEWRLLAGPSYGQYSTRIWSAYLFHSVPYYSQHKDDIEYVEYNKLGSIASLGCIRLQVVDVKWIYDNCPIGTPVFIYDDENCPGPMGKPGTIYIDPDDTELRGWDPTDPDTQNPWEDKYRTGTAIRSDAAWVEYYNAVSLGTWDDSISPTDLQGWSTDYKTEGTRG